MKAALFYPPATDPRAPQLALPSLAAVLRPAGIETRLYDLNLDGIEGLLERDRLMDAAKRLAVRVTDRKLIAIAEQVAEQAVGALAALRSDRFYDANEYNSARETVIAALEVSSRAAERELSYNIAPIRYDVGGADARTLADLVAVTADRRGNLWADLWERDLYPALEQDRPDLVGITITNRQQILPGLYLARELKRRGHFVVLGGAVYAKFGKMLAERTEFFDHFADGVVLYEGESALLELCNQLAGGRHLEKVPNLVYSDGGVVRTNPTHVENVAELPTPDFSGLPLERYLAPEVVLPILTGKGCYFNRCKFCDIPYINHISNKAYRVRSPERIVDDVRTLSRRFGSKSFVITDEALSPKLLASLAEELAKSPDESYSFTGYARFEPGFTPEVVADLAKMGLKKLFFGLESASQKTLDHMDKGVDMNDVPRVLEACRSAGMNFHVFSIIGFPEETEASARETYQFFVDHREIIEHPGNSFDIHPFGLELRTAYYDEHQELGVVILPAALKRDFVIGLAGHEWKNARGLGRADVHRLLEEEFHPGLKRHYRRWHNTPLQLWPGFEEYSMLYGERYSGRAFPFRTALPDRGEPTRFRLRFNPAFVRHEDVDAVHFASIAESFRISRVAHDVLAADGMRTESELFEALLAGYSPEDRPLREPPLRERLDQLIGLGLLQVALATN